MSWRPKKRTKIEKLPDPIQICRVVPPLVAVMPELLDVKIPVNYNPTQAIELLRLKIENRLLL